jgi:hypothetical protein
VISRAKHFGKPHNEEKGNQDLLTPGDTKSVASIRKMQMPMIIYSISSAVSITLTQGFSSR